MKNGIFLFSLSLDRSSSILFVRYPPLDIPPFLPAAESLDAMWNVNSRLLSPLAVREREESKSSLAETEPNNERRRFFFFFFFFLLYRFYLFFFFSSLWINRSLEGESTERTQNEKRCEGRESAPFKMKSVRLRVGGRGIRGEGEPYKSPKNWVRW